MQLLISLNKTKFGAYQIMTHVLSRHSVKAHTNTALHVIFNLIYTSHLIRSLLIALITLNSRAKGLITLSKEDGLLHLYKNSFYLEFH